MDTLITPKWHTGTWTPCDRPTGNVPCKASEVDVDTTEYRFSHGREPRGRGSWIFEIKIGRAVEFYITIPGSMTYGAAKKLAVKEAAEAGADYLSVAS